MCDSLVYVSLGWTNEKIIPQGSANILDYFLKELTVAVSVQRTTAS